MPTVDISELLSLALAFARLPLQAATNLATVSHPTRDCLTLSPVHTMDSSMHNCHTLSLVHTVDSFLSSKHVSRADHRCHSNDAKMWRLATVVCLSAAKILNHTLFLGF